MQQQSQDAQRSSSGGGMSSSSLSRYGSTGAVQQQQMQQQQQRAEQQQHQQALAVFAAGLPVHEHLFYRDLQVSKLAGEARSSPVSLRLQARSSSWRFETRIVMMIRSTEARVSFRAGTASC